MGMMVGAVITPIFLQTVLGKSALVSGLVLMPGALIMAGMGPIAGKIFDRFGPRVLNIVGLSIIILGCGLLSFLTPSTPLWYVGGAYTFRMVGITLVNMPISTWGLNSLPNAKIAHGNAIINTTRQVAGSMGTALLVTIMTLVSGLAFMPGGEQDHVAMGISAAFAAGALLTMVGLVLAIVRVRGGGEEE
jgi:Na+/melibiose symporter-like transporter